MNQLKIKFWMFLHDRAEEVWHFAWKQRVKLGFDKVIPPAIQYHKIYENEEVTIYRSQERKG